MGSASFLGILSLSLLWCSGNSQESSAPCAGYAAQYCRCTLESNITVGAVCEGGELQKLVEVLPVTLQGFIYKLADDQTLGTGFQFAKFQELQELSIVWSMGVDRLPFAKKRQFRDESLFQGLTSLHTLRINIPTNQITPKLFLPLSSLSILDLSNIGFFSTKQLAQCYNESKLYEKPLRRVLLRRVAGVNTAVSGVFRTQDLIANFKHNSGIIELDISDNQDIIINLGILLYLPHLEIFRMNNNNIKVESGSEKSMWNCFATEIWLHRSLKVIEFENCGYVGTELKLYPKMFAIQLVACFLSQGNDVECVCQSYKKVCGHFYPDHSLQCDMFPRYNLRDFYNTECHQYSVPLPENLEVVMASKTQFLVEHIRTFGPRTLCLGTNKLRKVDISYIEFYNLGTLSITGLDNLEEFNIDHSQFGNLFRNPQVLHNMPSLEILGASGTNIGIYIANDTRTEIFMKSANLTHLYLSNAQVTYIAKDEFKMLKSLEVLELSNNNLKSITFEISTLLSLQHLDFSAVDLKSLNEHTTASLSTISSGQNLSLDISGNVFQCQNCDVFMFIKWVNHTRQKLTNPVIFVNVSRVLCDKMNDEDVQHTLFSAAKDLDLLKNKCFVPFNSTLVVAPLVVGLMLLIFVMAGIIGWKKRWKLRLLCIGFRHRNSKKKQTSYKYDAFVVYADEDRQWVHETLLENLETEMKNTLCIHFRDFIPGHNIEAQIDEAINSSRKTILVMSPHFLQSSWCDFEMQVARNLLLAEGKDVIVPVILEPLPKDPRNATVKTILATKTYLEWETTSDGQEYFWKKLDLAIHRKTKKRQLSKKKETSQGQLVQMSEQNYMHAW